MGMLLIAPLVGYGI